MKILTPLGWLYGMIAEGRNSLYERGVLHSADLGVATISVGNITTGGTGKTPLVAHIAELLAGRGEKVCILTRGYGRRNEAVRVVVSDGREILTDIRRSGDEPVELARRLGEKAVIIADRDRLTAARWAIDKFGVTAFILDDGFQHRRIKRDLDIVCIDAINPFDNYQVIPAGTLREPLDNMSRADLIAVTRAGLVPDIGPLTAKLKRLAPSAWIVTVEGRISSLLELSEFSSSKPGARGRAESISQVRGRGIFAFCAIGNPSSFYRQLESEGYALRGRHSFPDHHPFTEEDVRKVESSAVACEADVLVTTAKDAVRLDGIQLSMECYVAMLDVELRPETEFNELISSLAAHRGHPSKRP